MAKEVQPRPLNRLFGEKPYFISSDDAKKIGNALRRKVKKAVIVKKDVDPEDADINDENILDKKDNS